MELVGATPAFPNDADADAYKGDGGWEESRR